MTVHEGRLRWEQGETWYRVHGDLDPAAVQVPVVVLHGGPGAGSDYTWPIAELLHESGRTAIVYDQLGCGRSTHLPDAPAEFWTVQLFKDELQAMIDHLGIARRYVLVGQSWGGMLAMDWARDRRPGLVALGICDSPASMVLWVQEANRLRAELPPDVEATLRRHEDAGTTDDPAYTAAVQVYYDRHLCRVPMPDCVRASFDQMAAEPTVYHTMNGPSEFHCIGSLRTWDITDDLHRISVPTLLVSGRHDEATPLIVGTIHERIAGSEWVVFEESSHMPHVEEPAAFRDAVSEFLARHDT
jgi:L-proline amide hydrolase